MKYYPLLNNEMYFRGSGIAGIFLFKGKIAIVQTAFGDISEEEHKAGKNALKYVVVHLFPADFSSHKRLVKTYETPFLLSEQNLLFYQEGDKFFINTWYYKGFSQSFGRIIEVGDNELIDIAPSPAPIQEIYNDGKTYHFEDYQVRMKSSFVMECRQGNRLIWTLKTKAYLYSEIFCRNGILYFGTAGKGGGFWAVSLADGCVKFQLDTGGTEHFIYTEQHIILVNKNNKPIFISSQNGEILSEIPFGEFVMNSYQQMLLYDEKFYAIAVKNDELYAVCCKL